MEHVKCSVALVLLDTTAEFAIKVSSRPVTVLIFDFVFHLPISMTILNFKRSERSFIKTGSDGAIIGGVLGGITFIVLIAIGICAWKKQKKEKLYFSLLLNYMKFLR